MSYIAAGVGLAAGAGGAFLQGQAGDIVRNRLNKAANLPGLDVDKLTGEALGIQSKYLPQATDLASQISASNQKNLLAQEEASLPGAQAAREKALGSITDLFGDNADWLQGIQRRGAALGLSSGLFGSQAGQLQTLRLSDREQQQRTQLGTGLLGSLLGTLHLAGSPNIQSFLPTTSGYLSQRSGERAAKQQILTQAAGVPGQTAAWANYLSSTGGLLTGAAGAKAGQQQAFNVGPSATDWSGYNVPSNIGEFSGQQQFDYLNMLKWAKKNPFDGE